MVLLPKTIHFYIIFHPTFLTKIQGLTQEPVVRTDFYIQCEVWRRVGKSLFRSVVRIILCSNCSSTLICQRWSSLSPHHTSVMETWTVSSSFLWLYSCSDHSPLTWGPSPCSQCSVLVVDWADSWPAACFTFLWMKLSHKQSREETYMVILVELMNKPHRVKSETFRHMDSVHSSFESLWVFAESLCGCSALFFEFYSSLIDFPSRNHLIWRFSTRGLRSVSMRESFLTLSYSGECFCAATLLL